MSLENNGGYPAPEGVFVARNVQEAIDYAQSHNFIDTWDWFVNKVQGGGEWDYRNQGEQAGLDPLYYQDIGNFNFGAVGSALGFSEYALENMGGLYQVWRQSGNYEGVPFIIPPFGDDPVDFKAIQAGAKAAKDFGVGNNIIDDFISALAAVGNSTEWQKHISELTDLLLAQKMYGPDTSINSNNAAFQINNLLSDGSTRTITINLDGTATSLTVSPDGARYGFNLDSAGHVTSTNIANPDGTNLYYSFDPASGNYAQWSMNGNGELTELNTSSNSPSYYSAYDAATGQYADWSVSSAGDLLQLSSANADGSTSYYSYDPASGQHAEWKVSADGELLELNGDKPALDQLLEQSPEAADDIVPAIGYSPAPDDSAVSPIIFDLDGESHINVRDTFYKQINISNFSRFRKTLNQDQLFRLVS